VGADGGAELPALDPAGLPSVGEVAAGAELALLMLDPAGLPSVGENEKGVELPVLILEPAGLPSVGEDGTAAELALLMLEPAGLPSVGEDGRAVELGLAPDSPAGATGVEAELGPLLPAPMDDSAGEDDIDAWPDVGRLGVVAPDGATEEEPEPVGVAPEGAEAEEYEAEPETDDSGEAAVPLGRAVLSESWVDAPMGWLAVALLYVDIGLLPLPLLELGAEAEDGDEPDWEELEEASPLAGEPEVALGLPLVGADDEATGCDDDSAGWEAEPTGCTPLAELDALASGPVPEEVGGRMPLEIDDRDEVPSGPEALVGLGGRMGFGE
jgi:hypothetical protein